MIAAGLVAASLTVLAGRWGQGLFTVSEFVHFSVNFPTVPGERQLPREDVGGPWARLDERAWKGFPTGGLLAWGREGRVTVDLGHRGILKELLQPRTVRLSSHWIRNIGARPYRVRIELSMCNLTQRRVTFERCWDDESLEVTRPIPPGGTFNMDWIIELGDDLSSRNRICRGAVLILDADSGDLLTRFPVDIEGSEAPAGR